MSSYVKLPNPIPTYPAQASLPAVAADGAVAVTLADDLMWIFDGTTVAWVAVGSGTAVTTIGALDGNGAAANGASISGVNLYMQSASGSVAGLVNITTQTLAGAKTFSTSISSPTWKLTGSVSGTLTMTTASTTTTYAVVWPSAQGGSNTFLKNDGSGGLSWAAGTGASGVDSVGAYDTQPASADGSTIVGTTIFFQSADVTNPGMVNATTQSFAGNKTFTGTIAASNLSGTNTGNVTLAAVGAVPNANAASLSGQILTLQPADLTNPGVVTTASQSFGGTKTFANIIDSGLTANTVPYADGSKQLTSSAVTPTELGYVSGVTSAIQTQLNAKQSTALTSAHILVGNVSNVATDVAMSGDISITNAGVTAYAGTVPLNKGGTGQTTKAPAFDALSPMTTLGDVIYGGASGTGTRLGVGSSGDVLTVAGGVPTWAPASTPATASTPYDILNIGVSTSVSANAMTINLLTKALATPSVGSPVTIAFRDSTSATGDYVSRTVTGALSIVITAGATLGATAGFQQYIYLCAIDNSGTVELAVIGSRYDLDEGLTISSTTMSSGADSYNIMYSTTGRSNVAFRVLARIGNSQSVAGTYANNSNEISLKSIWDWPMTTSWSTALSFTPLSFGTVTSPEYYSRREGDTLFVKASWRNGTVTGSSAQLQLPGLTVDSAKVNTAALAYIGQWVACTSSGSPNSPITAGRAGFVFTDPGAGLDRVLFGVQAQNQVFVNDAASTISATSYGFTIYFDVPIQEWRSY